MERWPESWREQGVLWPLVEQARPGAMPGHLKAEQVREGVPRGRYGLRQRRVRPGVFGEPRFEAELVPADVCSARPHVAAWIAWRALAAAGSAAGLDAARLDVYSAYRAVTLQEEIWKFRLEERRQSRRERGLPALSQRALERVQRKWTAKPGQSAHHTGLAIDLGLYHEGVRTGRRTAEYAWLATNAACFGFYPYLPEPWHWEFNPPGFVEWLGRLRGALGNRGGYDLPAPMTPWLTPTLDAAV